MSFDAEKSFVMAERLKKLREEKGLSHEKLSIALSDQYSVKISSDSLMNYEVADKNHTKAGKNQGMRVEYLRCLADYYKVSTDYILGIDDIKSPNCDTRASAKFTGLSEESISFLHSANEHGLCRNAIPSIDKLLLDYRYHNYDQNSARYHRPILNLINFFLNYNNAGICKQAYIDGRIEDLGQSRFISPNAIALNDIVIENAVLAEIQQALISLKRNLPELEE